jgi:hypothetical protein
VVEQELNFNGVKENGNCFQARGFTCRAFTYAMEEKRCYLSGDDSISLSSAPLVAKRDAVYAEKQCSISKYTACNETNSHPQFLIIEICGNS